MSDYSPNIVFFSIIIPLYNREKYVSECLKSVLDQTYGFFEAIVVDDGSTDNGASVVKEFVLKDNRIKYVYQKNAGPYMARRNGIFQSKGKYLLFLDSDDCLYNKALYTLKRCINETESDFILFNISKKNTFDGTVTNYGFENDTYVEKSKLYELLTESDLLNNLASKCVRRTLLKQENLPRIDHFVNGEDFFVSLSIVDQAEKPYYLNRSLYYYRLNENSTTANYSKYMYLSFKISGQKCLEYAHKWENGKYLSNAKGKAADLCVLSVINEMRVKKPNNAFWKNINTIMYDDFFYENIKNRPLILTKQFYFTWRVLNIKNHFLKRLMIILLRLYSSLSRKQFDKSQ